MAPPERRRTGAFYTPFALVETRRRRAGTRRARSDDRTDVARAARASCHVLDPACGSGAFLVHALERVAALLARARRLARDSSTIRRDVLTRSIYGVDLNPTAVWLCELRLWLSVVIESDESRSRPPCCRCRISIATFASATRSSGSAFGDDDVASSRRASRCAALRERYARRERRAKGSLARQLERAERDRALASHRTPSSTSIARAAARPRRRATRARSVRRSLPAVARRASDRRPTLRRRAASLRALRAPHRAPAARFPSRFPTHFADVAARGGFDARRRQPAVGAAARHSRRAARRRFGASYEVARAAAWEPGAAPPAPAADSRRRSTSRRCSSSDRCELLAPAGRTALCCCP